MKDLNAPTKMLIDTIKNDCISSEMLKAYVMAGADINFQDESRNNICHYIASNSSLSSEILETLVTLGVDINALNNGNTTPLHIAACDQDPLTFDVLQTFVKFKADLTSVNDDLWDPLTCLSFALEHGAKVLPEVVDFLIESGCPVDLGYIRDDVTDDMIKCFNQMISDWKSRQSEKYEKDLETGELCSVCGKRYLTVFDVPDDVWLKVNGGKERGLICISCVDEIARKLGTVLFWKAKERQYP